MCSQRTRVPPARAPCGLFPTPLAAAEREPGRAKGRARLLPQKPYFSPLPFPGEAAPSARVRALLLLGPSETRRRADGQGPRAARGRARDRAHSAAGQEAPSAEPRPTVANPRRRRGRGTEGALSLGYFSLGKQREVTRPPGWRTKQHRDVSRLSCSATSTKAEAGPRPSPG